MCVVNLVQLGLSGHVAHLKTQFILPMEGSATPPMIFSVAFYCFELRNAELFTLHLSFLTTKVALVAWTLQNINSLTLFYIYIYRNG